MNENRNNEPRRPDCVTEVRMGNTVLVVSGYFKKMFFLPWRYVFGEYSLQGWQDLSD